MCQICAVLLLLPGAMRKCAMPAKLKKKKRGAVFRLQFMARKYLRLKPVNECDPITLEPRTPGDFIVVREAGNDRHVSIAYNPAALRGYLEATQDTTDPLTRRKLNPVELYRLARATGGAPIALSTDARNEMLARQEMAVAMERVAGGMLAVMMSSLENDDIESFWNSFHTSEREIFRSIFECGQRDKCLALAFIENAMCRINSARISRMCRHALADMMSRAFDAVHGYVFTDSDGDEEDDL